jgi:hypothetical protein
MIIDTDTSQELALNDKAEADANNTINIVDQE